MGYYADIIKNLEEENKLLVNAVNKLSGIKESDTGLAPPSLWDLGKDKKIAQEFLTVGRCTKIINPKTPEAKYMISIKSVAKYVVGLD